MIVQELFVLLRGRCLDGSPCLQYDPEGFSAFNGRYKYSGGFYRSSPKEVNRNWPFHKIPSEREQIIRDFQLQSDSVRYA